MCIRDRYQRRVHGDNQRLMSQVENSNKYPYWARTVEDCLKELQSSSKDGLSTAETIRRQQTQGLNELDKEPPKPFWERIKEQFEDLLVRILLLAAVISFAVAQFESHDEHSVPAWVEPAVIFLILIANASVGIWQDYDAERALDALKELQSEHALVLRDGKWQEIKAKDLVCGDIVQVSQGDKIPADIRVLTLKTLTIKVDQANLTGESDPVNKQSNPEKEEKISISQKHNILFASTLVSAGSAIGVVINIGMKTEIGKIQSEVQDAKKEEEDSPLSQRLDEFGNQLAKVVGIICIVIWAINFKNFSDPAFGGWYKGALYYFKVSVALAVAAVPEGLPAVITTCLALGTRRMAKRNAIVRKLYSVETLGCTTVICSDKTGTLTTNEMVVEEVFYFGSDANDIQTSRIDGVSYEPKGDVSALKKGTIPPNIVRLCESMSMNNESKLLKTGERYSRSGLPTEAALKVLVEKIGNYDTSAKLGESAEPYNEHIHKNFERRALLEFTRDRKAMSVVCHDQRTNKNILFLKGAPDYILKGAKGVITSDGSVRDLNDSQKKKILESIAQMANKGLRTLAICYKEDLGVLQNYKGPSDEAHTQLEDTNKYSQFETAPILIGVVALRDPPRREVKGAIEKCKKAGITVIMITGDIKETAMAIGSEIGIVAKEHLGERAFTGMEYEALPEAAQKQILQKAFGSNEGLIFARTEPRHKRKLVQQLAELNQITAMTGDGVNDAPALQQAHIGVAMGISGTDVAKEASKMILQDDNFATIVLAVEEGRAIYANMKSFIRYMISSNIGEVVSIFLTSMLGVPDGFNSIQLLWVNLVTDGFPATALSFNPADPNIMDKPPRPHDEPIITKWVFVRYFIIGTYVGIATCGIFVYWYMFYEAADGHSLVSFDKLSNWGECAHWTDFAVNNFDHYDFSKNPCGYFTFGKQKASTLSLSVLVVIEMFNALNALSEEQSLFKIGIFHNPWLLIAISMSMSLHCVILYVPVFSNLFSTDPLDLNDWKLVILFSFPVVILDEILKIFARQSSRRQIEKLKSE
eukprot:TRINITY_DN1735_c0_g1_i1.p1 TRINITY_DN1735_c0_g1~~TRINITY_DN1735_c0_g1_i1.p1  ORF type:complete len:1042 (+),score=294.03 TRINITY_DN1735_c0_g1_i1:72-3197(+)